MRTRAPQLRTLLQCSPDNISNIYINKYDNKNGSSNIDSISNIETNNDNRGCISTSSS